MKKVVCFVLAIIMMLSMTVTAFAAGNNNSENAPHIDPIFDLVDEISMVPQNGTLTTTTESIVVTGTISDADKIQALINEGIVECGLNGELPTKVVVTQIIDNTALNEKTVVPQATAPTTPISITKSDFFDGRYFEEYDRYMIDGPSEFTETYSRTSTANWNSDMTSSVEVSGKIYSVAEVKGAVSKSMEYTIGESYTKTANYKVNIPENKYWVIKVWTSYRVFTYTAKVGTVQIATGKSWYPNGLVILHTEHNS